MELFPSGNTTNEKTVLPTTITPSIYTPTHAPLVTQIPIIVNIKNKILNSTQHSNESEPNNNQYHPGEELYSHYAEKSFPVESPIIRTPNARSEKTPIQIFPDKTNDL